MDAGDAGPVPLLVTGARGDRNRRATGWLAQLFFGGASGPTLVFWLVWMFLFTFYQPELVRTFKKWND